LKEVTDSRSQTSAGNELQMDQAMTDNVSPYAGHDKHCGWHWTNNINGIIMSSSSCFGKTRITLQRHY